MWVGGQRHFPAALTPEITRNPLFSRYSFVLTKVTEGAIGVTANVSCPVVTCRVVQTQLCHFRSRSHIGRVL
jgi:hypothetical protein